MSDGAPRGETPMPRVPNAFERSMKSGRCAICTWKASEDPNYDEEFSSNYMVIHFAERHFGELPYRVVRAVELALIEQGTRT
jgi:hypothetical protein